MPPLLALLHPLSKLTADHGVVCRDSGVARSVSLSITTANIRGSEQTPVVMPPPPLEPVCHSYHTPRCVAALMLSVPLSPYHMPVLH